MYEVLILHCVAQEMKCFSRSLAHVLQKMCFFATELASSMLPVVT